MRIEVDRDLCVGAVLLAFGGFVVAVSRTYAIGTAAKMGPGFFPLMVGALIAVLGLALTARALAARRAGQGERAAFHPGPLLVLVAGLVVFALLAEDGGMALAIAALVAVSACAGGPRAWGKVRWRETMALAVALSALSVGLFVTALGLPLRVWPAF
jgi:hypothetical protein